MPLIRDDLQFGGFTLERSARQLRRGEQAIVIPPKAFDLLLFLAERPGRPLLKDEIMAAVWQGSIVEESNLTQNIFLLRKALAPDGPTIIKTLPGRGYQFSAQVTEAPVPAFVATTQTLIQTRVVYEEDTEERVPFWRSPLSLAVAGLMLVLLVFAGWLGWQRWEDHVAGPPVQVVLADLEGGTGDPVLDRTLSNVLRIELTQSPFVTVIPASAVRRTLVQMRQKPDAPLTADLAREVCERTSGQAVLHGSIARAGSGYLLMEEAADCVDGATLGAARQEARRAEDLPDAVAKLDASIRRTLGESRRTIARFNKPLIPVTTRSLEALRDYSEGSYLANRGHFVEAIELLKQAVAIDPQFAAAYLDLSLYTGNVGDVDRSRTYLLKAYELREYSVEPQRLFIVARYESEIAGDLFEGVRNYQAWIALYPRSAQAWSGMTGVNLQLGRFHDELEAARRTAELAPGAAAAYEALANAQLRNDDYAASKATCDLAISRNLDNETIRYFLLDIGHLTHNRALIAAQEDWGETHPDSPFLFAHEANYAQNEGRIAAAEKSFQKMMDAFRRQGIPSAGDRIRQGMSVAYAELGKTELARRLLHAMPVDPTDFNALLAQAELGEADAVDAALKVQLAKNPQSTLWNLRYAPLLRGELAMQQGKPLEAIQLMEPSRQLDGQGSDGYYLRGKAYMQGSLFPQAEAEFRYLIAHPGIEVTAYQLPMSQLQLARVLRAEGKRVEAIAAYRTFLQSWSNADQTLELATKTKRELAQLESSP